jgi:hypothetical protein
MVYYETFAPNFTHNNLSEDRVIATGSINVYGFIIANDDNSTVHTVTLEDADGAAYTTIVLGVNTTFISDIPFLAANGLTVDAASADADLTFTIFHSAIAGAA